MLNLVVCLGMSHNSLAVSILIHRKYSGQHNNAAQVGCCTVKYTMAFLHSDWLYFYITIDINLHSYTGLDTLYTIIAEMLLFLYHPEK